jgi:hypothetical protein
VKQSWETIGQKRILVLGEGVDIVDQRQLAGEESARRRVEHQKVRKQDVAESAITSLSTR